MKKGYQLCLFALLLALSMHVFAQTEEEITIALNEQEQVAAKPKKGQAAHEISFVGGGGLSTLDYSTSAGEQRNGYGGAVGLSYAFYHYRNWGVVVGADIAQMTAETRVINQSDAYTLVNADGSMTSVNAFVSSEKERQTLTLLRLPVMLQFTTQGTVGWYMAAGTKVCFPIKAEYRYFSAAVDGNDAFKSAGKLSFRPVVLATAETGIKVKVSSGMSLYFGLYVEYGADNMLFGREVQHLAVPSDVNGAQWQLNSVLNSSIAGKELTDKVNLFSVGGTVRLTICKGLAKGGKRWKAGSWKPQRRKPY